MVDPLEVDTVIASRADVLAMVLLQRRERVLDAYTEYRSRIIHGSQAPVRIIAPEVEALFLSVRSMLRRDRKEKYEEIEGLAMSKDAGQCMRAFEMIDQYLDEKNLTKLDTRISTKGMGAMQRNKVLN